MRVIEVKYAGDECERRRIMSRLNRLYWAFMFVGCIVAAYGIGWFQGFTAP